MKELIVKNDGDKPVVTEILAESIIAIAEGMKKLRGGRMNDKALFLLIQSASPTVGNYPPKKITIGDIKAVFEGIDSLEKTFLKKKL